MPAALRACVAGGLLVAAWVAALGNHVQHSEAFVLLSMLVLLDGAASRRGHPWHSPPRFLAFALTVAGLLGWLSVSATKTDPRKSFAATSAHLVLNPQIRLGTLCFFLIAACVAMTAAIVRGFGPQPVHGLRITQVPSWLLLAGGCR